MVERGSAHSEIGSQDAGDDVPAHAEVLARSELARWLLPSAFPATAAGLTEIARAQGAPDATVEQLGQLASTLRFDTFGELWNTLDGPIEHAPDTREPMPAPQPEREAARVANVVVPAPAPVSSEPTSDPATSGSPVDVLVGIAAVPARVALGAVRTVGHLVGRGVALINPAHRSSN